jgi:hypothetical protein
MTEHWHVTVHRLGEPSSRDLRLVCSTEAQAHEQAGTLAAQARTGGWLDCRTGTWDGRDVLTYDVRDERGRLVVTVSAVGPCRTCAPTEADERLNR